MPENKNEPHCECTEIEKKNIKNPRCYCLDKADSNKCECDLNCFCKLPENKNNFICCNLPENNMKPYCCTDQRRKNKNDTIL